VSGRLQNWNVPDTIVVGVIEMARDGGRHDITRDGETGKTADDIDPALYGTYSETSSDDDKDADEDNK